MTFYFAYSGNKKDELKEILKNQSVEQFKKIIEPFGGSIAFSRNIFSKYPDKEYIISDNDKQLIYFCNNFYKNDDEIINEALKKIDEIKETKEKYNNYIHNEPTKETKEWIIWYLLYRTYYSLRLGLYPIKRSPPNYTQLKKVKKEINNFFEKNHYNYDDYKNVINKYKNDEDALIFLDPPYINSDNCFYNEPQIDWEFLMNFFNDCKCKFILVVNNDFFMKLAFKKWFKYEYSKIYLMSKKEVKHCVFSNY